jgi:ATP-dependent protease ClpP protease subunit
MPPPLSLENIRLSLPDWCGVHKVGEVVRVHVHDEIGVTGSDADSLLAEIGDASKIQLCITDCYGGSADTALRIVDALKDRKVEVIIRGKCFSAGMIIAMAGQHISIHEGAELLIHGPQVVALLTLSGVERVATSLRNIYVQLLELFSNRTGQDVCLVDEWLSHDTRFTPETALAVGLVDQVLTAPHNPETPLPIVARPTPTRGPTEEERLFHSFLAAFGPIQTRNKGEFVRAIQTWVNTKVNEL